MDNSFQSDRLESDQIKDQVDQVNTANLESRIRDAPPVSDKASGITNVPLDRINETDVQSPADFSSPEQYAGMRREADMLKQMQPALEQDANPDTFDTWDKANKIGQYSPDQYVRGYTDVYQSFHGSEAVAVEPKSDGTFDVLNGRHRIFAAREAGLSQIPVRIVG